MPRSFTNGDYTLLLAVESASRPQSWYRVLADRRSGAVSCDCPPFIFNRQHDAQGHRRCQHTAIAAFLSTATRETGASNQVCSAHPTVDPLLAATQEQWPGLHGTWSIERRTASIQQHPYLFVLVRLAPGNGGVATGVVAFAERHHPSEQCLQAGVAGWAGYAIAAEVARRGGFPPIRTTTGAFPCPTKTNCATYCCIIFASRVSECWTCRYFACRRHD